MDHQFLECLGGTLCFAAIGLCILCSAAALCLVLFDLVVGEE